MGWVADPSGDLASNSTNLASFVNQSVGKYLKKMNRLDSADQAREPMGALFATRWTTGLWLHLEGN
jgi:predicted DNA-binding ribbon-helix-helix protein